MAVLTNHNNCLYRLDLKNMWTTEMVCLIGKICKQLPASIERVLSSSKATVSKPNDTVFAELRKLAGLFGGEDDLAISMAVYLLGFNTYEGFRSQLPDGVRDLDNPLVGLYKYAQR